MDARAAQAARGGGVPGWRSGHLPNYRALAAAKLAVLPCTAAGAAGKRLAAGRAAALAGHALDPAPRRPTSATAACRRGRRTWTLYSLSSR
jgi:hypothetical protein